MGNSIDEIIRNAMERGEFDNLSNKGKKLNLDEYFDTPEEVRLAYSILKDANFLPEEVGLLKEIFEIQERLKTTTETEIRHALIQEIETRQLKYNLLVEQLKRRR